MKDGQKIKFALVGAGRIGKRHIDELMAHQGSEIVGICDVKNREDLDIPSYLPLYLDLQEMLKSVQPDVVCVCTPNYLHHQIGLEVLKSGAHVLIEKPLSLKTKDCNELIKQSEISGKSIFTVMQNRYSPPSKWIKGLMDQDLLGKIFMVQIECFWNRNKNYYHNSDWKGSLEKDGGTIFTQFSHFIDIMYWLFGDIKNIQSNFKNFNHQIETEFEDSGNSIFDFVDGGSGTFSFSTSVYEKNYSSSMTIIGEKGTVRIGGQYMNEVEYCNIENYSMPKLENSNSPNDYGDYQGSASNHFHVVHNVIETLRGNDFINTPAFDGLMVVDIINRMYEAGNRDAKFNELNKRTNTLS